jgi:hypothetical protein
LTYDVGADGFSMTEVRVRVRVRRPGRLHGSPTSAAARAVDGTLSPIGRLCYSASTLVCVPNAKSQPGGYGLGNQAGEAAIRDIVTEAGFTRFRRAAETPFNLVYEARP